MKELRNNPQACADYLNDIREDGDEKVYRFACQIVLDAHGGIDEVAKKANLDKPTFNANDIDKMMNSIGLEQKTCFSVRK